MAKVLSSLSRCNTREYIVIGNTASFVFSESVFGQYIYLQDPELNLEAKPEEKLIFSIMQFPKRLHFSP